MHYNIQSLLQKVDILYTGLRDFDIIGFTETWLNNSIPSTDLLFNGFHQPIRKDRSDSHGGVAIYVNENISFKRRHDLEFYIMLNVYGLKYFSQPISQNLFGVFYRPPSADRLYTNAIGESIGLARETRIHDIFITGDFNINALSEPTTRKINELCLQYDLTQLIYEPTHYTEQSSFVIDLIFVSNENAVLRSGVGESFLDQMVRYHCPVFVTLKFTKPKGKTFYRHIWRYDIGDYTKLRKLMTDTNWDTLKSENIDIYAENITKTIKHIAGNCIPNKNVCIRSRDLPWLYNIIKKKISNENVFIEKPNNRILIITGQIFVAPEMMLFYFYVIQKMNILATLRKKLNPLNFALKTGGRRSKHLSHLAQTIQLLLFTMIKQVPLWRMTHLKLIC